MIIVSYFMGYPTGVAKNAKAVLKNEAIIAVLSASIVAPFVVPQINKMLDSVPILKDHKSIASFASSAFFMKSSLNIAPVDNNFFRISSNAPEPFCSIFTIFTPSESNI